MQRTQKHFNAQEKKMIAEFETALKKKILTSKLTPKRKAELQANARYTLKLQKASLAALLPKEALLRFRVKAQEKQLSEQAFLSSILNQYMKGELIEKK